MKKIIPVLLCLVLMNASCVNDNQNDLFPRVIIPDSLIQGQVAFFEFDSSLYDKLGNVDPLKFRGNLKYSRDHNRKDNGAVSLDGLHDYLSGFIGKYDSLAISLWFLPMPNNKRAILFDYGVGQFAAGLDAITSATVPAFEMYIEQDTARWTWSGKVDYFYWHHLYIELGDTSKPPRLYVDGYMPDTVSRPWKLNPVNDLFYLGRPSHTDFMDTLLYRGYIDELKIFNKFLTDEEILNLYWGGRE
ncbi:MAG: hypothetical protein PHY99_09470 [Bacteroidales bacterium]|nr:hypothetical protein [Bacteroidales bacterium]